MPVDKKLLEILCCPISHQMLGPLPSSKLEKLNKAIESGAIAYVDGEPVSSTLNEALLTDDGKVIYAVQDDIPVMLPERGIGTLQITDF
jgi:uncharacterized protein YbaR (Trm112 family)